MDSNVFTLFRSWRAMVSVYDIAKIAGVSATTVSNVLNGRGRFSDKTRDKVLSTAQALGYATNVNARNLRARITNTVGIVTPDVSNDYPAHIVLAIERAMRKQGFSSFICNTSYDADITTECLVELKQRNVDAIFFVSCESLGDISIVKEKPCAVISHRMSAVPKRLFWVKNDIVAMVHDQTETLYNRGCRRIALLALLDSTSSDPVMGGYRRFLVERELNYADSLCLIGKHENGSRLDARDMVKTAITSGMQIDGIVVVGDRQALGACEALAELGITPGNEVKVIGMDNSLYSQLGMSGISTVERNPDMMAAAAAGAVAAMIRGEEPTTNEMVIPHRIVERATTLGA